MGKNHKDRQWVRERTRKEWLADCERYKHDAAVVLDALLSPDTPDTIHEHPALYDMIPWLLRLAVEQRKHTSRYIARNGSVRSHVGRRSTRLWEFRPILRTGRTGRKSSGRGDVFCLFCCQPIHTNMLERSAHDASPIDYGKTTPVKRHTVPCALMHLAGLARSPEWGSVVFPDPEAPPL